MENGPDLNAYRPNKEIGKVSLTRLSKFKKEHSHRARTPIKIPPACVKDQTPCSLEKRKAISKAIRLMNNSPSNLSPVRQSEEYDG